MMFTTFYILQRSSAVSRIKLDADLEYAARALLSWLYDLLQRNTLHINIYT